MSNLSKFISIKSSIILVAVIGFFDNKDNNLIYGSISIVFFLLGLEDTNFKVDFSAPEIVSGNFNDIGNQDLSSMYFWKSLAYNSPAISPFFIIDSLLLNCSSNFL